MKLSILREVGVGGATVTNVARRHDVTRQHIYQWRRQLRDKGLWPETEGTVFLALEESNVPPAPMPESVTCPEIGISFPNGRALRCPQGMAEADIIRLIRLVETA